MTDRREQALAMAARGINVFIIDPGTKRPLAGKSWYVAQSTDETQINEWFEYHEDCNYGVHLGSEYVVIDLDVKPHENGIQEFEKICAENDIPDWQAHFNDTLTVKTPGGGYHLYFKAPFGCANRNNFPGGIDIRGQIGYVVGPGSHYDGLAEGKYKGDYEYLNPDADIQMLPNFLAEYIIPPGEKDPKSDIPVVELDLPESTDKAMAFLRSAKPAIEGQNGDDHIYMTIQHLRDVGLSEEGMFVALLESGWNDRCDPPWSDGELDSKIRNAWKYGQNRPGIKSPEYEVKRLMQGRPAGGYAALITDEDIRERFHPTAHLSVSLDDVPVEVDTEVPQDVYDENEDYDNLTDEEKKDEGPLLTDFDEFAASTVVREYVVADWLLGHGITHLIAKRGAGKSTVALDLACHVATDRNWCGQPTVKGWKVIYLCGEDAEGMRLNCRAWKLEHEVDSMNKRFMIADNVVSLNDDTILNTKILQMMDWVGDDRCIVILDTWQRSTSGKSKNDEEAMEAAIMRAERIASHVHGPLLSLVHPPKDGRMTVVGAGVQENTSSGLWKIEEHQAGIILTIARAKGPGEGKYTIFELRPRPLDGNDQFNRPLTGVVAIKTGGSEDKDNVEKQTALVKNWSDLIVEVFRWPTEPDPQEAGFTMPSKAPSNVGTFLAEVYDAAQDKENFARQVVATAFVADHMSFMALNTVTSRTMIAAIEAVFCPKTGGLAMGYTSDGLFNISCPPKINKDGKASGTLREFAIEKRELGI